MLEPILDHVPNRVCFVGDLRFQLFGVTLDQTPELRGNSSILTCDVPPLASREGLSDIERVQFRVTQKN